MMPNEPGRVIERWWHELARKFPGITPGEFVVMPNHFHGIIEIGENTVGADLRVCPDEEGAHTGAPLPESPYRVSLSEIIQWFKTMTTNEYIRGVKGSGWEPFPGRLWQRNYYEHIIRDDPEFSRIVQYTRDNPLMWSSDPENPSSTS
jgi:REP element-mobilizing transposase RayT